ncbi:MAG: hypothetical protein ABJE66_26605 [Deltaproteobacteria bacterium]
MDDDELDFSAWAAPTAPTGLADRVVARVKATDAVAVAAHHRQRTRRVFWWAGGLVATLATVIAVIVLTRSPEPRGAPGTGTMVATVPQQLSLPGVLSNVDPGANVSWQIAGNTIHVQQHSGAITWRVDKPHLFLDVGAAVASIEASNATLRVETRMNLTDARVIGAAALTSAAVALVTVSVYEGQAKLSGAGQTVVVQPGTTYGVVPGKAPEALMLSDKYVDEVVEQAHDLEAQTVGGGPGSAAVTDKTAKPVQYAVETSAHGYKFGPVSGDAIEATMKAIEPSLIKCIKKRSDAQILHFDIDPDGTVAHLYATIDDPVSNACVVNLLRHTRFPKAASDGTSVSYSLAPPCDADKLLEAGTQAVARGVYAAGLKSFEAALDCKYDDHTIQLTFMTACSAGNVAAARRHWKTLATETKSRLLQMCLRNHITEQQLDE